MIALAAWLNEVCPRHKTIITLWQIKGHSIPQGLYLRMTKRERLTRDGLEKTIDPHPKNTNLVTGLI